MNKVKMKKNILHLQSILCDIEGETSDPMLCHLMTDIKNKLELMWKILNPEDAICNDSK